MLDTASLVASTLEGPRQPDAELMIRSGYIVVNLAPAPRVAVQLDGVNDFLNVPEGALVKPKDPLEYVRKLRFQQSVSSLSDYGVTPAGCAA